MVNSGDNESNMAIIEQQKSGLQDAADEILYTELLMHIFEKNPDALLICDENGKIVLVNSQLELLSGKAYAVASGVISIL